MKQLHNLGLSMTSEWHVGANNTVVDKNGWFVCVPGAKANHAVAKLIAAAPDLYDSLLSAMAFVKENKPIPDDIWVKSITALIKAGGECTEHKSTTNKQHKRNKKQ